MESNEAAIDAMEQPEVAEGISLDATVEEAEAACTEQQEDSLQEETDVVAQLQARVSELEEQLAARQRLNERIGRECAEFEDCFPEVSLRGVPDEVWGQVRAGVPLAAAYALFEKKSGERLRAEQATRARCATMPTGLADAAGQEYFSPAQVRAMSQREVRENYDRIFESMRHWQ